MAQRDAVCLYFRSNQPSLPSPLRQSACECIGSLKPPDTNDTINRLPGERFSRLYQTDIAKEVQKVALRADFPLTSVISLKQAIALKTQS